MIKPPRTAVLAAVVATGVGCKTSQSTGGIPPDAVGTVAYPEPVEPEPEVVPDTDPPSPAVEKVGTTARPKRPEPRPVVGREADPPLEKP